MENAFVVWMSYFFRENVLQKNTLQLAVVKPVVPKSRQMIQTTFITSSLENSFLDVLLKSHAFKTGCKLSFCYQVYNSCISTFQKKKLGKYLHTHILLQCKQSFCIDTHMHTHYTHTRTHYTHTHYTHTHIYTNTSDVSGWTKTMFRDHPVMKK